MIISANDKFTLSSITSDDKIVNLPVSQTGHIWQLGQHRLMCGDSTQLEQVQQLMNGTKADLVFTDPPYNVSYGKRNQAKRPLCNDSLTQEQFIAFLHQCCVSLAAAVKPEASLYICHGTRYQREFQDALEANGFIIRNQLIWAKGHFAQSFARYKGQHEPIFYCHVKGQKDVWYGNNAQTQCE